MHGTCGDGKSRHLPENVIPFSDGAKITTRTKLKKLLLNCFQMMSTFLMANHLSMHDTCETILAKIKEALVIENGLRLDRTCLKAKILDYKNRRNRVACYASEDPTAAIPYEESQCHPLIVLKY